LLQLVQRRVERSARDSGGRCRGAEIGYRNAAGTNRVELARALE
jgi:hypothetical protein